jgi:hypothetical protein
MLASEVFESMRLSEAELSIDFCESSLDFVIDSSFAAVNIAIVLRDAERFDYADNLFRRILSKEPAYVFALVDYSISLGRQGRYREAIRFSVEAVATGEYSFNATIVHIRNLLALCEFFEAEKFLNGLQAEDIGDGDVIYSLVQFSKYLYRFPQAFFEKFLINQCASGNYLSTQAIFEAIQRALIDQVAFSVIRLGDGEGAWISIDNVDEAEFNLLYRDNRKSFLNHWWGSSEAYDSCDFRRIAGRLWGAVDGADIIGIPDAPRFEHEFRLMSSRGISTSGNIIRKIVDSNIGNNVKFSSNNCHYSLSEGGYLMHLLRSAGKIGLISGHVELGGLIRNTIGKDLAFEIVVPLASYSPSQYRVGGPSQDSHLAVFQGNIEFLNNRNLQGVLVFVAAGFLGKFYLEVVKSRGGIAVDVGGVADGWAIKGVS